MRERSLDRLNRIYITGSCRCLPSNSLRFLIQSIVLTCLNISLLCVRRVVVDADFFWLAHLPLPFGIAVLVVVDLGLRPTLKS